MKKPKSDPANQRSAAGFSWWAHTAKDDPKPISREELARRSAMYQQSIAARGEWISPPSMRKEA